jgi:hypothetical protein
MAAAPFPCCSKRASEVASAEPTQKLNEFRFANRCHHATDDWMLPSFGNPYAQGEAILQYTHVRTSRLPTRRTAPHFRGNRISRMQRCARIASSRMTEHSLNDNNRRLLTLSN